MYRAVYERTPWEYVRLLGSALSGLRSDGDGAVASVRITRETLEELGAEDVDTSEINTVLLALLSLTVAYHSYLGVQVVIEDYVHSHGLKITSLVLSRFAHVFVAVVSIYAILRIGLGA